MENLKNELTYVYTKREEVRTAPTAKNSLELADQIAPSLDDDELWIRVSQGAALNDGIATLHAMTSGDLHDLDARFLRTASEFVTNNALLKRITEHLESVGDAEAVPAKADRNVLLGKIRNIAERSSGSTITDTDQREFVCELLALDGESAPSHAELDALLAMKIDYQARVFIAEALSERRGAPGDWKVLFSESSMEHEFFTQQYKAISHTHENPAWHAEVLRGLRTAIDNPYNTQYDFGSVAHGFRPTYESLGAARKFRYYVDRFTQAWAERASTLPSDAEGNAALAAFTQAHNARMVADAAAQAAAEASDAREAAQAKKASRGVFGFGKSRS